MAARRPFADLPQLMTTAGEVWDQLAAADWLEAFAAHPRLGESGGSAPASSEREQSRIMSAEEETLSELATENRDYEARFGRVFLFSAAGRTAAEVLAALRERMSNDPATELNVAAAEQRKITRLRLESMLQG
jgi:OHCU decarboxylase